MRVNPKREEHFPGVPKRPILQGDDASYIVVSARESDLTADGWEDHADVFLKGADHEFTAKQLAMRWYHMLLQDERVKSVTIARIEMSTDYE